MRRSLPLSLAIAAALAGCNSTTLSGHVGDTLSGDGGVRVTLQKIDLRPPIPADDITGLSTPAPGDRLVAARVKVCSTDGQAIGTFNFSLTVAGGGNGTVKSPSQNYANNFDAIRIGCAGGWIVFELPASKNPDTLHFDFDDTGSGGGGPGFNGGGKSEAHDHFSWPFA